MHKSDLVDRLRFRYVPGRKGMEELLQESADTIEAQAGEIERLRKDAERLERLEWAARDLVTSAINEETVWPGHLKDLHAAVLSAMEKP